MNRKPRVSFFVHDLSKNSIGRAAPIALAISSNYEVEVLGFLIGGDKVNEPHRRLFEYRTIRTSTRASDLFRNIWRISAMATGDIVYACKPLMTSLAPALCAARARQRRPLFLDVEDDDWQAAGKTGSGFVHEALLRGWRLGTSWKYTALLHQLVGSVDGVTVVSRKLQERYGGTLLRSGPDERRFDPARFADGRDALRDGWNLPRTRKLALFGGTPRPHKGIDTLTEALLMDDVSAWDLVLIGPSDNAYSRKAMEALGDRCHYVGHQPYERMPELLALADAAPIPQKRVSYAEHQVPVKLLDALAMGCPVIASRVGDLPEILGEGRRGWVVEPDDPRALASALIEVAARPAEARRRGEAGREWFLEHASPAATLAVLDPMFRQALSRSTGRSVPRNPLPAVPGG